MLLCFIFDVIQTSYTIVKIHDFFRFIVIDKKQFHNIRSNKFKIKLEQNIETVSVELEIIIAYIVGGMTKGRDPIHFLYGSTPFGDSTYATIYYSKRV